MKQIIILILTTILFSCQNKTDNSIKPKRTVITGKILDFKKNRTNITLFNQQLCVCEKREILDIDSSGNFHYSFINNSKRDLRIRSNRANFLFLAFPGDSIHIEFYSHKPKFWSDITFTGDRVEENKNITGFQKIFIRKSVSNKDIYQKKSTLSIYKFVKFMDSIQQKSMEIVNEFENKHKLTKTELTWVKWYASEPYYYNMYWFPTDRRIKVNSDYYNFQNKLTPLLNGDLSANYNIGLFINEYISGSIKPKFIEDNIRLIERWKKDKNLYIKEEHIADSLMNETVLKYSDGETTKNLVLTSIYASKIKSGQLKSFERNMKLLKREITTDFLKNSLFDYYYESKRKTEKPSSSSELLVSVKNASVKQTLDSIFNSNKGKVLVFDFWGTYCGPCIGNFPKIKLLMDELKDYPVKFVFFCLDGESNKERWKNIIYTHNIDKATHYCLTAQQATELKKIFEIHGIPHYSVFDSKGKLRKNGTIHFNKKELIKMTL